MRRARLRNLTDVRGGPLVITLSSLVSGTQHIGVALTSSGGWVLDCASYINDPCNSDGTGEREGCAIATQLKILRRVLAIATLCSPVTIITTHPGVAAILTGWMTSEQPVLPEWYRLDGSPQECKLAITMRVVRDMRTRLVVEQTNLGGPHQPHLELGHRAAMLARRATAKDDGRNWLIARLEEMGLVHME